MKGILKSNAASKIYGEGRTYDNKLYTFKESDYRTMWNELDIWVREMGIPVGAAARVQKEAYRLVAAQDGEPDTVRGPRAESKVGPRQRGRRMA